MSTTDPARRPLCARCQLPLRSCLCAWIRPTVNHMPLLVLQHPREANEAKGSLRLVLLDGTWRKTRKMLHNHPLLRQLPRCTLSAAPPSLYAMRKAQRPEQRSTLEAACLALGALEGRSAAYAPLLNAFEAWVQSKMLG